MKKELFAEAEQMLNAEVIGRTDRISNHKNMIDSVKNQIQELNQGEKRAITEGNLSELEEITTKKIVLERELEMLTQNNNFGEMSGELKKEESMRFYKSMLEDLRKYESDKFAEISEQIIKLHAAFEEEETVRQKFNQFYAAWSEKVAPFVDGQSMVNTKISTGYDYIKKSQLYKDCLSKSGNNLISNFY